ncbi:hypothetical protein [Aliikangiella sp. IMCC44359]|uniref:hypothetical protein n=1 Tax=Aliikangiella sp. IMCC44359 TaxID=3459125 RepID=UPI00403AB579
MEILNITNGSNAVDLMNKAGIQGEKIPWDDLLHEGPVPIAGDLEALSRIRVDYITSCGWGDKASVSQKFKQRNECLLNYSRYNQVVLWFEHDLYDQLQLIQILGWFKQQTKINTELKLICSSQYLGHHTVDSLVKLKDIEQIISTQQLDIAWQVWAAFTSDNPYRLNEVIKLELSELPYLKNALLRLVKEYPDSENGLPLTEHLILKCLKGASLSPIGLFNIYQKQEAAEFMGDSTFWSRLNVMAKCKFPLVKYQVNEDISYPINPSQSVSITDYGREVLNNKHHWFLENEMSKSIGGANISPSNYWCWHEKDQQLKNNEI